MTADVLHNLRERVKELTALHTTARILQDETKPPVEVMEEIAALLPSAWQYPEITAARISFQRLQAISPGFAESVWQQTAAFTARNGETGAIEIFYLESSPLADEGPFLKEERDLIDSLAEMLRSYFQHKLADEALQNAHDDLEAQVKARTVELEKTNTALQERIAEYRQAEQKIERYQKQLQQLATELCLAEARERRVIAEDLHDHIGQALALIKMDLAELRGNAIFCGFEDKISEMNTLLEQTIQYSRSLTFEISPPSLYELGLTAAIDGLVERFRRKHKMAVTLQAAKDIGRIGTKTEVFLFKSIQELLTNTAKHADARHIRVSLRRDGDGVMVQVEDDGRGFDPAILEKDCEKDSKFGLFNIKERFNLLGGSMEIHSSPGNGTKITLVAPVEPHGEPAC
ncbi:MAG: ATP-binding protein [candidate division Zixibacteria bacterium]|nr:ATP-binding protein [candidate division Zixibacteria bacterium]